VPTFLIIGPDPIETQYGGAPTIQVPNPLAMPRAHGPGLKSW